MVLSPDKCVKEPGVRKKNDAMFASQYQTLLGYFIKDLYVLCSVVLYFKHSASRDAPLNFNQR